MKCILCIVLLLFGINAAAKKRSYKVLSYNIRYDNPADSADNWQFRKEELAARVLKLHPDIIAIQESLLSQTNYLKTKWSGFACYAVGREDGMEKGEMIPVFYDTTKFRCVESNTLWLSETPLVPSRGWDAACERVIAKLALLDKLNGDTVFVFNTHWDHVGVNARRKSSEMICGIIQPLVVRNARVVLAGDFNAAPQDEAILQITSLLKDTCPARKRKQETFNGFNRKGTVRSHIDFIFISSQPASRIGYSIGRWLTRDGRWLSDHHSIFVSVCWKQ